MTRFPDKKEKSATESQRLDIAATLLKALSKKYSYAEMERLCRMKRQIHALVAPFLEEMFDAILYPKEQDLEVAHHYVPVEGVKPWNCDEAGIVDWIRRNYPKKTRKIEIISGYDPVRISKPQDFFQELFDVHEDDDPYAWIDMKAKFRRAIRAGSNFGWRELILCCQNLAEIHPSWLSDQVCFAKAVCEIDGVRYTATLGPISKDIFVSFVKLDHESNKQAKFPILP